MKLFVVLALVIAAAGARDLPFAKPAWSTGFVIKGRDAAPHSAPYIVSMSAGSAKHNHQCGGTLIAPDLVLTAAHCIKEPKGMSIIAGLHDRTNVDAKTQSRIVEWGVVHEKYAGNVGPYDIALLRVSKPFEMTPYVQTAKLPAAEAIPEGEVHLYGWGQPSAFDFSAAKILQTVKTDIIPYPTCEKILGDNSQLHPTNVCSDSKQLGISACNGDSGGPLVIERQGQAAEIVGVVSWGFIPCGSFNKPSIYTRVSAYIDWIKQEQRAALNV